MKRISKQGLSISIPETTDGVEIKNISKTFCFDVRKDKKVAASYEIFVEEAPQLYIYHIWRVEDTGMYKRFIKNVEIPLSTFREHYEHTTTITHSEVMKKYIFTDEFLKEI